MNIRLLLTYAMNCLLNCILDPLFDYVSRGIGRDTAKLRDLLNFASICTTAADKHRNLMEQQTITNFGVKLCAIYNTAFYHGISIHKFGTMIYRNQINNIEMKFRIYVNGKVLAEIHCDSSNKKLTMCTNTSSVTLGYSVGIDLDFANICSPDQLIVIISKMYRNCTYYSVSRNSVEYISKNGILSYDGVLDKIDRSMTSSDVVNLCEKKIINHLDHIKRFIV